MPLLPSPIPIALSSLAPTPTYTRSGVAYNYAVGALPFFSAASPEAPIVRSLAPYRKDQFDNSMEPGEQSLDGWWLRSQMSFHHGAGQLYGDPGLRGDDADSYRFWTSYNADVWTAGQVSLLNSTSAVTPQPCKKLIGYVDPTYGDAVFGVTDTTVVFRSLDGGRALAEANPSATTLQSCAFDGTTFYVSAEDGVWSRAITSFGGVWTKIWNIGTLPNVIEVVKRRLVLATSGGVYELVGAGPALPTAKWTPAPTGITPTGITECGGSIFVSYYQNARSEILRFGLDGTGAMPTLSGGSTAAQLPAGELVRSILGYLDRYLLIGTSLGPRVAAVDGDQLQYGPLLLPSSVAVLGWTARDRFAWFTASQGQADGSSGLYRLDLSVDLGQLQFAYAPDLVLPTTADVQAVAHAGSSTRKYLTGTVQLYVEDETTATSGWLQGSRVRFATLEPKVYKLLRVRAGVLTAAASAAVVDPGGSELGVIGWTAGNQPGLEDHTVPLTDAVEYVSVLLRLEDSAVLGGWQLKALPATPRQRVLKLPLFCFDFEKDRFGVRSGSIGSAQRRLRQLEALASEVDVVSFQDLDANLVDRCVIESLEFTQTAPPSNFDGWGGIVTLTLRTV